MRIGSSAQLDYFESYEVHAPAIRGKKNLYKLFVCCGVFVLSDDGYMSMIVPMALLGDDQASLVRKMLLDKTALIFVDAFPQKDDPNNRVFPEAKLATTVFTTSKKSDKNPFIVRTHPGRFIEESTPYLKLTSSDIMLFDSERMAIPSCNQNDWDIVITMLGLPNMQRMDSIAESFQGEVNETNERNRGALTSNSDKPMALHGSNICLYVVRDASQGEDIFIKLDEFLAGKRLDSKAYDYKQRRIGFQRSSPQNNFRRLIAANIPKGQFCLDTVSYVTEQTCKVELDLLVAFLNSKILDWFFRLGSTNSKVNEYQFNALPVPSIQEECKDYKAKHHNYKKIEATLHQVVSEIEPGILTKDACALIVHLCREIQIIEKNRTLSRRSERSRLSPDSQVYQDAINSILFKAYGLDKHETQYINERLGEML